MPLSIGLFIDDHRVAAPALDRQARALRERGHRVTVIDASHSRSAPPTGADDDRLHIGEGLATWGRKTLAAAALFLHRVHRERQPGQRRLREIFSPLPHHGPVGLREAMVLARRSSGRAPLRFDVVLAQGGPAGVRAGRLIEGGLLAGPLAVSFHGPDLTRRDVLRTYGGAYRHLFALVDQLLPVSRLARDRLIELGARPTQVEVLHVGVPLPDTPALRPIARDRPLRVLTVAGLTQKKGLAYGLEGLIASGMTMRYTLIGDGPLRQNLEILARQAGPQCEVEFLGQRNPAQVLDALHEADVFLLPSATTPDGDVEGLPVSLMEAMAAGVLVVATRHGALPELVVEGETGFLVPERDPVAIAEIFRRIAGSGGSFETLRAGALRKVREEFNAAVLDTTLEAICRRLATAERAVG